MQSVVQRMMAILEACTCCLQDTSKLWLRKKKKELQMWTFVAWHISWTETFGRGWIITHPYGLKCLLRLHTRPHVQWEKIPKTSAQIKNLFSLLPSVAWLLECLTEVLNSLPLLIYTIREFQLFPKSFWGPKLCHECKEDSVLGKGSHYPAAAASWPIFSKLKSST